MFNFATEQGWGLKVKNLKEKIEWMKSLRSISKHVHFEGLII
ncbi:hypothetical protein NEOC65_001971 [Neochlamydia sp. AcF65]|nr:hypothetical protein [Neochlamydia sp. AcF65]MBS4171445.1 hypothetical protein [Neochlamydia sp. AcF95]